MTLVRLSLPIALLLATACAPSGVTPTPGASPSPSPSPAAKAEGCEHLSKPGKAVTAAAPASAEPPIVRNDHARYEISLPTVNGRNHGLVRFESGEAGEYVLLLDKDLPLRVRAANSDTALELETTPPQGCAEARARHAVDLGVGVYWLEFGPADQANVNLVIEHVEGHGH